VDVGLAGEGVGGHPREIQGPGHAGPVGEVRPTFAPPPDVELSPPARRGGHTRREEVAFPLGARDGRREAPDGRLGLVLGQLDHAGHAAHAVDEGHGQFELCLRGRQGLRLHPRAPDELAGEGEHHREGDAGVQQECRLAEPHGDASVGRGVLGGALVVEPASGERELSVGQGALLQTRRGPPRAAQPLAERGDEVVAQDPEQAPEAGASGPDTRGAEGALEAADTPDHIVGAHAGVSQLAPDPDPPVRLVDLAHQALEEGHRLLRSAHDHQCICASLREVASIFVVGAAGLGGLVEIQGAGELVGLGRGIAGGHERGPRDGVVRAVS